MSSVKIPAKGESGYMSCPRNCGIDVRAHHSSDLVNGGCDTGPMGVANMVEWFEARGVGQPGCYTMTEALAEFYGKSEDEMDKMYDDMCGSTA